MAGSCVADADRYAEDEQSAAVLSVGYRASPLLLVRSARSNVADAISRRPRVLGAYSLWCPANSSAAQRVSLDWFPPGCSTVP